MFCSLKLIIILTISHICSSITVLLIDLFHNTRTQAPPYLRIIKSFINARLKVRFDNIILDVETISSIIGLMIYFLCLRGPLSKQGPPLANNPRSLLFDIISNHVLLIIFIFMLLPQSLRRGNFAFVFSLSPWFTRLEVTKGKLLHSWVFN